MPREQSVELYLKDEVEARGGRCVKLLPWVQGGLPDRLVLLPGGRVWFIETKAPGVTALRPLQRRWRRILLDLGMNYRILNTRQAVGLWLKNV